jgi:hypothetical protein
MHRAELYARFKDIQEKPNVQAVLVGIHGDWNGDWNEALSDPELWPAAENVHIYTTASDEDVEGWPHGMHPAAPKPQPGYRVMTVFWD